MNILGILLIFLGTLFIILGLDISGKIGKLGHLPGDILWQKGDFIFYFPFGTALLISVLFTILFVFFNRIIK